MTLMTLQLDDAMKRWVEDKAAERGLNDPGQVVRDLIHNERARHEKIANMQRLVDEARAEPTVEMMIDEILTEVREQAGPRHRDAHSLKPKAVADIRRLHAQGTEMFGVKQAIATL